MSLRQRIIVNVGSNWASMVTSAVVGLLLVPVMIDGLGLTSYGVWVLLAYGLSYSMILEGAFALATNRFAACYRDDSSALNRFVSASFATLIVFAVLTILAAIFVSFIISDVFTAIPIELSGDAQIACILVGVTLALNMVGASFSGALRGCQFYARANGVEIVRNLIRAILVVGLLAVRKSIAAVQLAHVISSAASAVAIFWVARKSIVGLRVDFRGITKTTIRELWRYTFHSIARSGSSIVMYNTLTLLVGWKGDAIDVTVYNVAFRVPVFARTLLNGAQSVFLPVVTSFGANGQTRKVEAVVKKGTHATAVLTCTLLILLFIFTEEILALWLRGAVPEETVVVMRVLIVSIIPGGLFEIWLPVLVGMGFLRGLTIASIVATISAIVLAMALLSSTISLPMVPAITLVVVLWARAGVWLPLYGLHKLRMRFYEYFREGLSGALVASIVSISALWMLKNILHAESIHWLANLLTTTAVIMASFITISLRREAVGMVVAIRRKFREIIK